METLVILLIAAQSGYTKAAFNVGGGVLIHKRLCWRVHRKRVVRLADHGFATVSLTC